MQPTEIRLRDGILLIGAPVSFPQVLLRAGDQLTVEAVLRLLGRDTLAMNQLRKVWRKIHPTLSASMLSDGQLVTWLRRDIGARRLHAVLLREYDAAVEPGKTREDRFSIIHVPMDGGTLLIAPKGQLPPQFADYKDSQAASVMLGQLSAASSACRQIDRQAGRWPDSGGPALHGLALRQQIAREIERGAWEAVVLTRPDAITQAAARRDAPLTIAQMNPVERVMEAMSRSRDHVGGEVLSAMEQLLEPRNLLIMAGFMAAVAAIHINPVAGAAADTALIAVAWASAGLAGVVAAGNLILATIDAIDAETEPAMDEAAKRYAAAFVGLGASLIEALLAKFVKTRTGKGDGEIGTPLNRSGRHAGDSKPLGKTPDRATTESSSRQGSRNTSKAPIKYGKKRIYKEPGSEEANQKNLKEYLKAKHRYNNGSEVPKKEGWPPINSKDAATFANDPDAITLEPGKKIYRIIDYEGGKSGSYWTTVDPRTVSEAQWRSGNAVRGDWNGDGAFVEYSIPNIPKDGLKVWSGPTAAQRSSDGIHILKGGENQIWMPDRQLDGLLGEPISTGWGQ